MVTIYALLDPETQAIRYVGKTSQPLRTRVRAHINRAQGQKQIRSAKWIADLRAKSLEPVAIVLEQTQADWEAAERFWIASLRATGTDLLNMTAGGSATPGLRLSPEAKAKVSAAARRQFSDPMARKRAAEFARAAWDDPDYVSRMKEKHRERATKPEYRANQSAKKKALWATEEYSQKVIEGHRNADHSTGAKRMWMRPEYLAKREALIDQKCAEKGSVRGVSFDRRRGKWMAQFTVAGVHLAVGRFDTQDQAAIALDLARKAVQKQV